MIASTGSLTVDEIFFDAGIETDAHGHHLSQVAYQVAGRFEVTLGDTSRVLGPGDGYTIPADTPHRVRCLDKGSYVLITVLGGGHAHMGSETHAHDEHNHEHEHAPSHAPDHGHDHHGKAD